MSDKVEFVDYQESLSIKVGRFLLSKGYDLASCTGLASNSLVETDSLGILRKDPEARPREYLFGLITRDPRRMFLGTVWLSNGSLGATEQNWVFEAYGRKHVELARQLAEEMASTFNVKIALRLVRDQPDVETYLSDYD
ncbi:hypothetical protein COU13_00515 [Candidatus Kaiserbacteria bacterium CG10_big_fil_rev_8_21_14_0_10_43_70]|uniref:Uncharacterized protein n=1 Tax=Candidatus Kaiserbacteria bacterium CG10_big_fil_rev_8_21_14_0_10_43_70 TaxID=1974605 RepID=A0A2H0UJC8_9BACT|nr:MAG: hypothetical protein COU13_00515 [Candidatus Kaiserbacteria bacterium CG10_big_fil_rev_8_21_14_0_10_43_70]